MNNTNLVKGVLYFVFAALVCLAGGIFLYNLVVPELAALPLPNFAVIVFSLLVLAGGFALQIALKKSETIKGAAGEEGVKMAEKAILTAMLVFGVFLPVYYVWFGWLPSLLEQYIVTLERRYILLGISLLFVPAVGACYYLVYTIWPSTGRVAAGLFLGSVVLSTILMISISQQPVKLFDRQGNSNIYYHNGDHRPYHLPGKSGQKFYDERDGTELVPLTRDTKPEVIAKIREAAAKGGLIRGFKDMLGFQEKKPAPPANNCQNSTYPGRQRMVVANGKSGTIKKWECLLTPYIAKDLTFEVRGAPAILHLKGNRTETYFPGVHKTNMGGGHFVFEGSNSVEPSQVNIQ